MKIVNSLTAYQLDDLDNQITSFERSVDDEMKRMYVDADGEKPPDTEVLKPPNELEIKNLAHSDISDQKSVADVELGSERT